MGLAIERWDCIRGLKAHCRIRRVKAAEDCGLCLPCTGSHPYILRLEREINLAAQEGSG